MITTFIITIVSFLLGYFLCYFTFKPEQLVEIKKNIEKTVRNNKVGSVKTIGADRYNLRKNKVMLEEDKLMTEEFDKLVENQ